MPLVVVGAAIGAAAAPVGAMLTYAAAGAMVGATIGQYQAAQESAAQQRAAFAASERRANIQNVRNIRQQIRAARLAQARMANVAYQTGGAGSSALEGGMSSVQSQTAGNINYMAQIAEQNTAIGQAEVASAQAQSEGAIYGAVGNLAGTIFGAQGGFKTMFKGG